MNTIERYYEQLAETYDEERFGRSYGRYVDQMERAVLSDWLAQVSPTDVVDLGCGTGRLLDFAMTGVDASAAMLKVAGRKHPDRQLIQAALPSLDSLFCVCSCQTVCNGSIRLENSRKPSTPW